MAYNQPFQITGFHSCDREVGLAVLNGKMSLLPSDNAWDWLGSGVYFWEQNPDRALQYAIDSAAGRQKNKKRISTPFVIGCIIELGNCLNLLEPKSLDVVKQAYEALALASKRFGKKMPENKGANRQLDCAVIKYLHEIRKLGDRPPYDTVRSAFHEGDHLYPQSNFTSNLHIEICIINPDVIKGYFLPMPIGQYNPYLEKDCSQD